MNRPRKERFKWLNLLLFTLLACGLPSAASQPNPTTLPIATVPATAAPVTSLPLPTPPLTAAAESIAPPSPLEMVNTIAFLAPGVQFAGEIRGQESARYHFEALEATDIILLANPDASLDPVLQLFDEEGQLLEAADVESEGEVDYLRFRPSENGRYTLVVTGFEGSTGAFDILMLDLSSDQTPFLLNIRDSVSADETKRYRLENAAGKTLLALLQPESSFDGVMEVYAPEGFLQNRDLGEAGALETAVFTAEGEGYLLTVTGFQDDAGSYSLRVIAFP